MQLVHASDALPLTLPATVHRVLVLAAHPDTAALLSAYVNLSGHAPTAPFDDETLDQALLRLRPRAAIVEYDHPSAASSDLSERFGALGIRTLLCAAWYRNAEARERALATGALYFPIPIAHRDFDLVLRTALLL